jgi:hypothetical protein
MRSVGWSRSAFSKVSASASNRLNPARVKTKPVACCSLDSLSWRRVWSGDVEGTKCPEFASAFVLGVSAERRRQDAARRATLAKERHHAGTRALVPVLRPSGLRRARQGPPGRSPGWSRMYRPPGAASRWPSFRPVGWACVPGGSGSAGLFTLAKHEPVGKPLVRRWVDLWLGT